MNLQIDRSKARQCLLAMAKPFSSNQRLRPLLPRTSLSESSAPPTDGQRRKPRAKTACEVCREHRLKVRNLGSMIAVWHSLTTWQCDGVRPKCQPCTQRGRRCHYMAAASETRLQALKRENKALRSQKSPYERLIEVMRSVSERDATDILARLRSGADIETLMSHVTNGDLLLQLSVAPETRFRYDLPYDKRMPASLFTHDNAYLQSPIHDLRSVYPLTGRSDMPPHTRTSNGENSLEVTIYFRPFHAAEVVDPRLADLNISAWTTVCNNNELMRSLLRSWLQCEY